ncbi:MAG: hypothetical protein AAFN77_10210 [Planctomycetota bacterium]
MLNFDFKKSSRKCYEDDKDFSPGDVFYSALVELDDGDIERRDFCRDHWNEPGEDCVGWWKARVPETGKGKIYWAPRNVLLSFFNHVLENPETQDVAYVTALVLVQKKILVIDDEPDRSFMRLRNRLDKTDYDVPVCDIEGDRLVRIQAELAERLFMDEPIDETENEEADID